MSYRKEICKRFGLDILKSVAVQETVQLAVEEERLKTIGKQMKVKYKSIPRWGGKTIFFVGCCFALR